MCAQYWNLNTDIKCPKCGEKSEWNLQTHFMGDYSCDQYYKIGEKVPLLYGMTIKLDRNKDWFIGNCPKCDKFFDFGAKIVDGQVMKIFLI